MTPQEVIKKFMKKLATHGLAYSSSIGTKMLDAAVRAASSYGSVKAVINAMKADQVKAEKLAVKEIFGVEKLLSELTSKQRKSVESVVKERKAYIFLEKYCGIDLNNKDTGAITGSDAGGSKTKTNRSVVPEIFINTYSATTNAAQIINTGSRNWIVQATSYNDSIISGGADFINAGAGNDQITANANGATIASGAGKDSITISENVSDITLADLTADDTLNINGTFEVGSAKVEKNLLVITDKTSTRKIRLGNFSSNAKKAKINKTTIAKWLQNAGINPNKFTTKNYSVDDVSTTTNKISSVVKVNLDKVNTSKSGNVKVSGKVIGKLSSTFPNASTFTRNGLTIRLLGVTSSTSGNPDNIQSKTLDELTDDQKTIVAALFKWWSSDCLTLNEESYGIGFNSPTTMIKEIGLYFYDSKTNNNTLATVWNWQRIDSDGYATKLLLNVNMHYYSGISTDNMDGSSKKSGTMLLDRALAHEFTHAVMAANINFFNSLPIFIKEGMAELTHGIDDKRKTKILDVACDDTRLANSLNLNNTNTAQSDSYAGGYMFLRYLAKQAATQKAFGDITATVNLKGKGNYYISGNSTTETASKTTKAIKLGKLSNGVYTVADTGVHQVINASSPIKIVGLTSNDTFNGTSGADTIQTAEGSNINTGAGNDSIKLYGQYATINAGAGNDTVNVVDGSHHFINLGNGNNRVNLSPKYNYHNTILGGKGNDVIKSGTSGHYNYNVDLGSGNNKILLYYATDNTIKTGSGNDLVSITGGSSNIISTGAGNDTIYIYGKNNTVYSGAGNDTLIGGAGDDSLWGGTGNDLIYGGDGDDIFIYKPNEGTDHIMDYQSGDMLKILKTNGKEGGSFSKSSFSGNTLTLTINGGGNVIFDGVRAGDVFNINGKNYTIKGKTLK